MSPRNYWLLRARKLTGPVSITFIPTGCVHETMPINKKLSLFHRVLRDLCGSIRSL
jgi:hypothetical protein